MDKEKIGFKRDIFLSNRLLFVLLWMLGHDLGWGLYMIIGMLHTDFWDGDSTWLMELGLSLGIITSLTQYWLIRWHFGRHIRAWISPSIIAWIVAAYILFPASIDYMDENTLSGSAIWALSLYLPATLVQALLLRKHVQHAWLWILASVVGSSLFALVVNSLQSMNVIWATAIGTGVYGGVTALTLVCMFMLSKIPIKHELSASSYEHLHDDTDDDLYEETFRESDGTNLSLQESKQGLVGKV